VAGPVADFVRVVEEVFVLCESPSTADRSRQRLYFCELSDSKLPETFDAQVSCCVVWNPIEGKPYLVVRRGDLHFGAAVKRAPNPADDLGSG
jgi:hypothetical protein